MGTNLDKFRYYEYGYLREEYDESITDGEIQQVSLLIKKQVIDIVHRSLESTR